MMFIERKIEPTKLVLLIVSIALIVSVAGFYDNRNYYMPVYVNQTGTATVSNALVNVTNDSQSLISAGKLDC